MQRASADMTFVGTWIAEEARNEANEVVSKEKDCCIMCTISDELEIATDGTFVRITEYSYNFDEGATRSSTAQGFWGRTDSGQLWLKYAHLKTVGVCDHGDGEDKEDVSINAFDSNHTEATVVFEGLMSDELCIIPGQPFNEFNLTIWKRVYPRVSKNIGH
jgi:hypothetical protein